MRPGRIGDSLRDLQEEREVVGPQIQEPSWTAKVEASVFSELSGSVFAFVSASLCPRDEDLEAVDDVGPRPEPAEGLSGPEILAGRGHGSRGRALPERAE